VSWKQTAVTLRPSLRALARELGTSHQLLCHYLAGLDQWRWEEKLRAFRTKAKAHNLTVTPADERRYLNWLKRIEERQARDAARAAKCVPGHAGLLDRLKQMLGNSWSDIER